MSKPTPTQEENDLAALGQHVLLKEFDNSSLDTDAKPPENPPPPEEPGEPDPKAEEVEEQKNLSFEPLPNPIGYKTRAFERADDAGDAD